MFDDKPEITDLICPITGSRLIRDPHNFMVYDGDTHYRAESDKSIVYARNPRGQNVFRLMSEHYGELENGIRFFKLSDDEKSWTELNQVPHGYDLFTINTPDDDAEWIEACKKAYVAHQARLQRDKYLREHPEEDDRIWSNLTDIKDVEVRPMEPPSGLLYFMNMSINSDNNNKKE